MAQLFTHTPTWVWLLLTGLCIVGYLQTKTREVSAARLMLLPVAMMIWSVIATYQQLGAQLITLAAWSIGLVLSCGLFIQLFPACQNDYKPHNARFVVTGSWLPLMLILGIFMTKYGMTVSLTLRPQLQESLNFVLSLSSVLGIFSGVLLGRAVRLLRSRQLHQAAQQQTQLVSASVS